MIGEVLMEILIPFIMTKIIDKGISGGSTSYTAKLGIIMVIMALVSLVFGAMGGVTASKASMGFSKNLRKKLFDKIQDFSFSNVDRFSTASLVTRLTTDVTNTQNAFMMVIRIAVRSPIMLIGATVMAVITNRKMSVVFLFAIPVLAVSLAIIGTTAHPRFLNMLKKYDKMNADVQENLIGMRVVKAFVREDYEKDKFAKGADEVRKAQVFAEKVVILSSPIMQLVMYSCIVAILWFGGKMAVVGEIGVGTLSGYIYYIVQILMSLMMISMIFIMLVISRASILRIAEVLDEEIDITDDDADENLKVADGSIEFKNVCFGYGKKNKVLSNINLSIKSGETIGIIGGTGSSKTSLVQLIPRFYDVTSGELDVGGRNVKEYKIKELRDNVSMVLQKNVLFSGTIKENLKWGNENAGDDEIIEAAKAAQAHDFIMSFPDKYDTDLGQGGVNVSGGQKQRLCIARAILKNPKILILDDSTSAVDTATDAKIRKTFAENFGDTTVIIIAQRYTSVMDADRIIVLDDGKIDGFGTHEELLATNKIYKEVVLSQQKGAKE